MADIFTKIDEKYAVGEFGSNDVCQYTHLVSCDGDHSQCGLALGGSAKVESGAVTCGDCIMDILKMKNLKPGKDYIL